MPDESVVNTVASAWTPAVHIDLETASGIAFQDAVTKFYEWEKTQPPADLVLTSGWHIVTPQLAEQMLRRNKQNRKLSLETVRKYARRMVAGEWKKTGQPILVDENGEFYDGQYRCFASYFSGASFDTYIVADVPAEVDLFAYLDEGKPRSAADALYTAGTNGLSSSIAAAIKLAWRYDHNALGVIKQPVIRALGNVEVLAYSRKHPGLNRAAHVLMGTYSRAAAVISSKGVAVFVAWKILDGYGPDALEEFFGPLGSGANLEEDDPILALRNRLMSYQEGDDDLSQPHRLALIIKGFNLHRTDQTIGKRGFYLRDNEKFPRFEEAPLLAEAAQ